MAQFRRLIIAFAIGVAVTIAISWMAMLVPYGSHGYGPPIRDHLGNVFGTSHKTYQVDHGRNAWHHVVSYWWMQVSGHSIMLLDDDVHSRTFDLDSLPSHLRPQSIDDIRVWAWYSEVGWPMKAMTCSIHWEKQIVNANVLYRVEGGVQLPRDSEFNPRALPLTPLWPGFLANTLLAALIWLMLAWLVGATRARWRSRRNRCIRCGYLRTGLPADSACPECGH